VSNPDLPVENRLPRPLGERAIRDLPQPFARASGRSGPITGWAVVRRSWIWQRVVVLIHMRRTSKAHLPAEAPAIGSDPWFRTTPDVLQRHACPTRTDRYWSRHEGSNPGWRNTNPQPYHWTMPALGWTAGADPAPLLSQSNVQTARRRPPSTCMGNRSAYSPLSDNGSDQRPAPIVKIRPGIAPGQTGFAAQRVRLLAHGPNWHRMKVTIPHGSVLETALLPQLSGKLAPRLRFERRTSTLTASLPCL
jgi:hypothetical protein